MHASQFEGIWFYEGTPAGAIKIEPIKVEIGGMLRQSQLRSLDDVKKIIAERVRRSGGNAIVDFRYGQKSVGFWRSLWSLDDLNWHGSGFIARLDNPSG